MFVPPTWIEGWLIQFGMFIIIPLIVAIIVGLIVKKKKNSKELTILSIVSSFILMGIIMMPVVSVYWHYAYELPSVQEKVITVEEWQPRPGIKYNTEGMMIIDNADQLMLLTTENEGFVNEENLLFDKFNTRDILNNLKINGTYKIKYYGWRNGFNSGFPNILEVSEVIDESNAVKTRNSELFGVKFAN
ncbi:MAG: DUF1523 family protein [Methanobacteriaceae archaeon]|jgi:hypothetical protein|nr:DUF1523 family protein [Candidatus Methanorudis spinitermitis]